MAVTVGQSTSQALQTNDVGVSPRMGQNGGAIATNQNRQTSLDCWIDDGIVHPYVSSFERDRLAVDETVE